MQSACSILSNDLGFPKVIQSLNLSANQLEAEFTKMKKRLEITSKRNEKTLLFIYYRGKGGVDANKLDTYALMKNGVVFGIERSIRELAKV